MAFGQVTLPAASKVLDEPRIEELASLMEKYEERLRYARHQGKEREVRRRTTEIHMLQRLLKQELEERLKDL